jgi:hypothetical protein
MQTSNTGGVLVLDLESLRCRLHLGSSSEHSATLRGATLNRRNGG